MHYCAAYLTCLSFLWNCFSLVDSNALLTPTSRGMMWTRSSFNSAGYNYMEVNCGGVHKMKQNDGKCGLCGDPYNGPREHETGGKYATGAIAHVLGKGESNLNVKVLLNVDLGGYFEFRLCAKNGTAETQECFDQHLLKITEGRFQGDEYAYVVQQHGVIQLTVEIPERVSCEKCVLQWKYVTGNTFGWDARGKGCIGCGIQDTYINCADITIKGWEMPTTPPPPTTLLPTTLPPTTPPPTTTTPSPPTTTKPAPPPSFAVKQNQFSTQRDTNSQAPRHVTKQRHAVTDFDEGSRNRNGNGNGVYPKAYAPVPAPLPQTPAVILPSAMAAKPVVEVPAPNAVVPQAPITTKIQAPVPTTKVPLKTEGPPPERPQSPPSGPLKIPRPPKLSSEQLSALKSDKNVIPHHDPLQKYVKVGSSKIVAAADFTTNKALQMPTPPPLKANSPWVPPSTDSSVQVSTRSYPPRHSGKHRQGLPPDLQMFGSLNNELSGSNPNNKRVPTAASYELFGNFRNEMSGGPQTAGMGGGIANEYGIDINPQQLQRSWSGGQVGQLPTGSNLIPQQRDTFVAEQGNFLLMHDNNRGPFSRFGQTDFGRRQEQQLQSQSGKKQFPFNEYASQMSPGQNNPLPLRNQIGSQHEVDIFGQPVSRTGSGRYAQMSQNVNDAYNPPSEMVLNSRYGTNEIRSHNSNLRPYLSAARGQSPNQPQIPSARSTQLPVIDTATLKNSNKDTNALWKKSLPGSEEPKLQQNFTHVPVNLFKKEDKKSFQSPVIRERFTNFQIGSGRENVPDSRHNTAIQNSPSNPLAAHDIQTFKNVHLNAGIHSPENFFGQDHYISPKAEMSNPSFGGAGVENVAKHHNRHSQVQNSVSSGQVTSQFNAPPSHAAANYLSGWNSLYNKQSLQHQVVPAPQGPALQTTSAPLTTTQQSRRTSASQIDFQMQEIKKLSEKLERLQQLLSIRQAETSTYATPTTTNAQPLPQNPYPWPQPSPVQLKNQYNNHQMFNLNNQNTNIPSEQQIWPQPNSVDQTADRQYQANFVPTKAPGMDTQTTQLIEKFKAQMLQSIEQANSRRNHQQSSEASPSPYLQHRNMEIALPSQVQNPNAIDSRRKSVDSSFGNAVHQQPNVADTTTLSQKDKYQQLVELINQRNQQKQKAEELNRQKQQGQNINRKGSINEDNNHFQKFWPTTPTHRTTRQVRLMETSQPPTVQVHVANSQKESLRTIDKTADTLADKIALQMAQKIKVKAGNKEASVPGGSMMSALRKIALSVLKEQQSQTTMPDISFPIQAATTSSEHALRKQTNFLETVRAQALEKPVPLEMHETNSIVKQKKISLAELPMKNTDKRSDIQNDINRGLPTDTASQLQPVPTPEAEQLESYKRRQDLIKNLQLLAHLRRPTHVSNTRLMNNDRPSLLPRVRPSHLGRQELVGSENHGPNNNRPTHIHDHPNNRRPNIYDMATTTETLSRDSLTQPVLPTRHAAAASTISSSSTQLANLSQNENVQPSAINGNIRVPPDIAKSMLQRYRDLVANRNSNSGQTGAPNKNSQDAKGVSLNRQTFLNLLKSMNKDQSAINGR